MPKDAKLITILQHWHRRFGHIGVKHMKKLHAVGLLESLDYESPDACELFLMGKMTKTPFRNNGASNQLIGNNTY